MKPHLSKTIIGAGTDAPTRRQFVGGLGTGLIAAIAAPALGKEAKTEPVDAPPQAVKQNPLEQYPKPPFQKQLQEWPGLAGKMTPPPDHGEKSYQGSGRLIGRKALITGGDLAAPWPSRLPAKPWILRQTCSTTPRRRQ